ncbi:hypothetical protein DL89DRAFT_44531 [Linderina pennispora]|uniref:S1 motif domain-containing protein n=1 Tax=Linderina pennispora TaxID=61395 RepID=A0A1Y1W2Q3_9FUNG|nr:uncharacterized protein DL89DRAFT_44531 [Linderina pennispora]ORX67424.1 hypothetical protein DL89DRAFT_44531 [Linderina pennispora]
MEAAEIDRGRRHITMIGEGTTAKRSERRYDDRDYRPRHSDRDNDRHHDDRRSGFSYGRYSDRHSSSRVDDAPILYKIYDGRVTNLKDFGAFVALEGVRGRVEGLVHISAIQKGVRLGNPREVLDRDQRVKVKGCLGGWQQSRPVNEGRGPSNWGRPGTTAPGRSKRQRII